MTEYLEAAEYGKRMTALDDAKRFLNQFSSDPSIEQVRDLADWLLGDRRQPVYPYYPRPTWTSGGLVTNGIDNTLYAVNTPTEEDPGTPDAVQQG